MWRTLLRPRWLALLLVLVVVVLAFARLGLWQLAVARDEAALQAQQEQAARPEVPVEELLQPYAPFPDDASGRPVSVEGAYDADRQFLVPQRRLEGVPGYWVVTPLVVDATGASLPAVRGFVTDPAHADAPEAAPVRVTGTLAPGESPADRTGVLTAGQRGSIDLSVLANEWPGELYNAFVFVTGEAPALTASSVAPVPPPVIGGDVDWRNLGYALQWWVFAAFAVFMYVKLLREDHRAARDEGEERARRRGQGGGRHTLEAAEERTAPHHV